MSMSAYMGLNLFIFIWKGFLQICLCLSAQQFSEHMVLSPLLQLQLKSSYFQ